MKKLVCLLILTGIVSAVRSQSIAQIKKVLDTTSDPVGYVKYVLRKKYFIDTIAVVSTRQFLGKADSLAYHGVTGKTYGPFRNENILVKILAKAPNTFYHVKHILIDPKVFDSAFAEILADTIMAKINRGSSSFAAQASTYSADYTSAREGGDLGWFVRGVMVAQLDRELVRRKKGDLFKLWSGSGLHIINVADDPKEDTGHALLLRILL